MQRIEVLNSREAGLWTETRPDNDEGQVRGLSVIVVTGRSLTLLWSVGQDKDTVQSRVTAKRAACAKGQSWAGVSKAIDIFPLSGFLFGPSPICTRLHLHRHQIRGHRLDST